MTEDDGFCRRGGIRQTPRWEKGREFDEIRRQNYFLTASLNFCVFIPAVEN